MKIETCQLLSLLNELTVGNHSVPAPLKQGPRDGGANKATFFFLILIDFNDLNFMDCFR